MADEWENFIAGSKLPTNFDAKKADLKVFLQENIRKGRNIALVSSGGTTVPLESRTVRFIDNFSVGTRGATSTEYFLRHGYAVIFLHRKGSLEPFKRHFMHINFLDMLELTQTNKINVKEEHHGRLENILKEYQEVMANQSLFTLDFTTLQEYLYILKDLSQTLKEYGSSIMFYLAAAVSDFHIPAKDMPEHKIQSSGGPLQISLQLVPKMLRPLVTEWAPNAFIVSFKLETDQKLLIPKAKQALENYKHQVVVGNILETRKQEVTIVTKTDEQPITLSDADFKNGKEIEDQIISELAKRHNAFKDKQTT